MDKILYEWIRGDIELPEIGKVYPLRITNEVGEKFYSIGSYVAGDSETFHTFDGCIFLEDEVEWLKEVQPSLKKDEWVSKDEYEHAVNEIGQLQEQLKEANEYIRDLQKGYEH